MKKIIKHSTGLFCLLLVCSSLTFCTQTGSTPQNSPTTVEPAAQQPPEPETYRIENNETINLTLAVPLAAIQDMLPPETRPQIIEGRSPESVPLWVSISKRETPDMPIEDGVYHFIMMGTVVEFQGKAYSLPLFHLVDDAFVQRIFPRMTPKRAELGDITYSRNGNDFEATVSANNTQILHLQANLEQAAQYEPSPELIIYRYTAGTTPEAPPRVQELHENEISNISVHESLTGTANLEINTGADGFTSRLLGYSQMRVRYVRNSYNFTYLGRIHNYLAGQETKIAAQFPADFPLIVDAGGLGNGNPIGGFGGDQNMNRSQHRQAIQESGSRPIILIHGNGTPSIIWKEAVWPEAEQTGFSVYQGLQQAGYGNTHIWALNYQGERGTLDGQRASSEPARSNIDDVRRFIDAVLDYTGAQKVDIIAVSLGCHMLRGYLLGLQSDGTFDPDARRLEKVENVVLLSGGNYGLGNSASADWDSGSSLFSIDPAANGQNSFMLVDGEINMTPGDIHYFTIYPEYDFTQAMYRRTGGAHPLNPVHTSQLGDAEGFMIPHDYDDSLYIDRSTQGQQWFSDPLAYLHTNHVHALFDARIFENYILPNLK